MVNVKFAVLGDSFVDVVAGTLAPEQLPKWGGDVECSLPIQLQPGGSALNTATHIGKLAAGHPQHALAVELHSVVGGRPLLLAIGIALSGDGGADTRLVGTRRHGRVRAGAQVASGGARYRAQLAGARGRPHGRVHRPQRHGASVVVGKVLEIRRLGDTRPLQQDRSFITHYGAAREFSVEVLVPSGALRC